MNKKVEWNGLVLEYITNECIYVWKNHKVYTGITKLSKIASIVDGSYNNDGIITGFNLTIEEFNKLFNDK